MKRRRAPVSVAADCDGTPLRFRWADRTRHVDRIIGRWSDGADWWHGTGPVVVTVGTLWRLETTDGLICELSEREGQWTLVREWD